MIEEIGEPINLIASFKGGKLTPLAFSWHNRCYEHIQVTSTWKVSEGTAQKVFFTVMNDQLRTLLSHS